MQMVSLRLTSDAAEQAAKNMMNPKLSDAAPRI